MSERVPAWAESDERYPEREAEWRAAIARAERAEAGLSRAIDVTNERDGLRFDLAAAIARAERAEAQLAALRDAGYEVRAALVDRKDPGRRYFASIDALGAVLADTAAAAEAYRASVEAPLRAEATRAVLAATAESYEARRAAEAERDTLRAEIERITARHDRRLAVIDDVRVALASPDGEDIRVAARRVVAERDTLAAALAEVREIHAALVANDALPREAWSEAADAKHADLSERLDAAVAALPADLAVERFRRERAEALEAAADAIERGSVLSQYGAHGWLRARAADERGAR